MTREGISLWGDESVLDVEEEARRGGSGRKLHEPAGRLETSVKISEMSRC